MERDLNEWKEWENKMTRKRLYDVVRTKNGSVRILVDPDTKVTHNDMSEYTSKMSNTKISKIKRRVQALVLSINF